MLDRSILDMVVLHHFALSEDIEMFPLYMRTTPVIVMLSPLFWSRLHFIFLVNQTVADTHHHIHPDLYPSGLDWLIPCSSAKLHAFKLLHEVQSLLGFIEEPVLFSCNFSLFVCLCTGISGETSSYAVFIGDVPWLLRCSLSTSLLSSLILSFLVTISFTRLASLFGRLGLAPLD